MKSQYVLSICGWLHQQKRRLAIHLYSDQIDQVYEFQRFAEFGRLSAGLIHEISTPLTSAVLTLDQIRSEPSSLMIRRARQDLHQLERYVIAARKQLKNQSNKTTFSLTVVIHQVAMLLTPRARESNVKLIINTIGSIRLYGDQVKLHQALSNLINNAIESYDDHMERRFVKINVSQKGSKVIITVADHGKGIKREDLQRIFEPFYSTKHEIGRGIGIGLATVKQNIEEEFSGRITVFSKYQEGTCFLVTIPIENKS